MQKVTSILNTASQQQRDDLAKLLPAEKFKKGVPASTDKLIEAIRWAHDSTFIGVVFKDPKSYLEILKTVAEHLEIKISAGENSEIEIEKLICQKVGQQILKKMNPEERAKFIAAVEKESIKHRDGSGFIGAGGVAAALVAGNMGGFGTYMLATTGLAAISGALGITLPFAAYAGLSTALGVALGPVGWVGLGLAALFTMGGPCYDKLIPSILYITMLRNQPKQ